MQRPRRACRRGTSSWNSRRLNPSSAAWRRRRARPGANVYASSGPTWTRLHAEPVMGIPAHPRVLQMVHPVLLGDLFSAGACQRIQGRRRVDTGDLGRECRAGIERRECLRKLLELALLAGHPGGGKRVGHTRRFALQSPHRLSHPHTAGCALAALAADGACPQDDLCRSASIADRPTQSDRSSSRVCTPPRRVRGPSDCWARREHSGSGAGSPVARTGL
jgi:hypothetical protein